MNTHIRRERFHIDVANRPPGELWQGDVLRNFADDEARLGIVVSADCDLLHDKGEVLCIPVVPIHRHLEQDVYYGTLAACVEIELKELRKLVNSRRPDFTAVSDEVLEEWICNRTSEQLQAELKNPHPDELALALVLQQRISALGAFLRSCPQGSTVAQKQFDQLVRIGLNEPRVAKKVGDRMKRIREAIVSASTPSRADLFVIPGIPGANEHLGFVAPFRRIVPISRTRIVSSLRDARGSRDDWVVIASCRPALTHALVQKLALFFSRVGITTFFENDQRTLIQIIADEVTA